MTSFARPLAVVLVLALALAARAAPGGLDPAFGHGGMESLRFGGANVAGPTDIALQPDGRILVATTVDGTAAATESFGVVRLLANGAADKSFGRGGAATTAFTNFLNTPYAMALQGDGRIVIAGNASSADATLSEFAVARFLPNGQLDASFGQGGKVTTNFVGVKPGGVSNIATAVLVQPDGRIVAGGGASDCAHCPHRLALARYQADGTLDPSFGTAGQVDLVAIPAPNALALLSNGHLLALSGSQLAEFDAAGVQLTVVSTTAGATIIAQRHTGDSTFLPDGRILVAGAAPGPFGRHDIDIQCNRLEPLGNPDVDFLRPVFDFVGVATAPSSEAAQAILPLASGAFAVGGISNAGGLATDNFGLARLVEGGGLDAAFGQGGTVTTVIDDRAGLQFSFVSALAEQPDGRLVAVGLSGDHQGRTYLALARYLAR